MATRAHSHTHTHTQNRECTVASVEPKDMSCAHVNVSRLLRLGTQLRRDNRRCEGGEGTEQMQ